MVYLFLKSLPLISAARGPSSMLLFSMDRNIHHCCAVRGHELDLSPLWTMLSLKACVFSLQFP